MTLFREWTCPCGQRYRLSRSGDRPTFHWPFRRGPDPGPEVGRCINCARDLRETRRRVELHGRQLAFDTTTARTTTA